jgi:Tfp pilus assembly protein PilF
MPQFVVRAMDRWAVRALTLAAAATFAHGCSSFGGHKPHYETVQADPHHDTALAEAEHAEALKYLKGTSCCRGYDPIKGEEHLQKALVADVTYGPAHNSLGMLYLCQHKLYLAAWEFEYAQKLMPDRFEPLYNLGLVYEAADKLDRAIEFYSMAFSIDPRNPDVMESLARARMRKGETVANVRPLLEEILFYERRPVWLKWARDQLYLAHDEVAMNAIPKPPLPDEPKAHSRRLIPPDPPPPDEGSPPPKVAKGTAPPPHATSTSSVVDDVFLDSGQPDPSGAPQSDPLAVTTGGSSGPDLPTTGGQPPAIHSNDLLPAATQARPAQATDPPQPGTNASATSETSTAPGRILFGE